LTNRADDPAAAAERCGRWRHEMTSAERTEFENHAGPLLGELGYA
jgi:hypothetical protein